MALYILISGSSWSFPAGWPGYATKVECLGSGGNGSARNSSTRGGSGGGGGEYAAETTDGSGHVNITSTPTFTIGTGGGATNTSITCDSITITAHPGGTGTTTAGGSGGTGSTNTTHFTGGAGRTTPTSTASGGGGGGAAGPSGAGTTAASNIGGAANNSTDAAPAAGNNGNSGTEWDASHGCGTGGSGFASATHNGTNGGAYGGGASGASDGSAASTGGTGGDGLIVITYTPLTEAVNITQGQHASLVAIGTLSTQGDTQSLSIGRQIHRAVAVSQTESIAETRSYLRTFSPSSPESVVVAKRDAKQLTVGSAELITLIKAAGKIPVLASPQVVSPPLKSVARLVSVTDPEALFAFKQATKSPTFSSGEVLLSLKSTAHPIHFSDGEAFVESRQTGKLISPISSQGPTILRQTSKLLTPAGNGEHLSITTTGAKLVAPTLLSAQSFAQIRQIAATRVIGATQSFSLSRTVARSVFLTLTGLSTLLKTAGHGLSLSGGQTITIAATRSGLSRLFTLLQGESLQSTKVIAASRLLSSTQRVITQGLTTLSQLGLFQAVSVAAARLSSVTELPVHAQSVLRSNRVSKQETSQDGVAIQITRGIAHSMSVSDGQSINVPRGIFANRLIQSTQSVVIVALAQRIYQTAISLLSPQSITLSRTLSLSRSVLLLQAQQLVERTSGHSQSISVSIGELISFTKQRAKTIFTIIVDPMTLLAQRAHEVDLTDGQQLSLRRVPSPHLSILQAQHASLVAIGYLLSHGLAQFISLARAVSHAVLPAQAESLSVAETKFGSGNTQLITATQTESISHIDRIAKGLFIPPSPIVTFVPPNPSIPSTALPGSQVALIVVNMSDGSQFAGQLFFGAPNFNDSNIFAIDNSVGNVTYNGNNFVTINPSGPGVGPSGGTLGNVTVDATALPLAGTQGVTVSHSHGSFSLTTTVLAPEGLIATKLPSRPIIISSGETVSLALLRFARFAGSIQSIQNFLIGRAVSHFAALSSPGLLRRTSTVIKPPFLLTAAQQTTRLAQTLIPLSVLSGQFVPALTRRALRILTAISPEFVSRAASAAKSITVPLSGNVLRGILVSRSVVIAAAQLVTRGIVKSAHLSLAQLESLVIAHQNAHALLVATLQSLTLLRIVGKLTIILSAATVMRRAFASKFIQIQGIQAVSAALRKPVNLIAHISEFLSLVAGAVRPHAVNFSSIVDPSQSVITKTMPTKLFAALSSQQIRLVSRAAKLVVILQTQFVRGIPFFGLAIYAISKCRNGFVGATVNVTRLFGVTKSTNLARGRDSSTTILRALSRATATLMGGLSGASLLTGAVGRSMAAGFARGMPLYRVSLAVKVASKMRAITHFLILKSKKKGIISFHSKSVSPPTPPPNTLTITEFEVDSDK